MGVPQNGWFIMMEKPSINGWFQGYPHFRKPPYIYIYICMSSHRVPLGFDGWHRSRPTWVAVKNDIFQVPNHFLGFSHIFSHFSNFSQRFSQVFPGFPCLPRGFPGGSPVVPRCVARRWTPWRRARRRCGAWRSSWRWMRRRPRGRRCRRTRSCRCCWRPVPWWKKQLPSGND